MRRVDSGHSTAELQAHVERADELRDLTQHPGWQAFVSELAEYEHKRMSALLNGKASENAADYAKKLGELSGLRLAPKVAESAVERGFAAAEELRNRTGAEEASAT